MSLAEIYRELKSDLQIIEKQLEDVLSSDQAILRQAAYQLLKAGGKRLRPLFVLLSARFGKREHPDINRVAVTLELIHMASLIHDDVIDDAELRRGKQTVKARWDNRIAMYTGDFIFAKALNVIGEVESAEVHRILSQAFREMCLGEIVQIQDQYNWNQNLRQYLLRIKRKTALLMAISCRLGAVAAGADEAIALNLYRFGYYIGMSYQIVDDILDFTGTEKQLGKPAASDIKQGNVTLPALYALQDVKIRDELLNRLKTAQATGEGWNAAIRLINESGAIERSRKLSDRYLQKAYAALDGLPDQALVDSFRTIADNIGRRRY
ncbi:heptaprenyl diphosphate synthase component II [Caenibacillus caldisaponilyticus]|jgi:heptaprenyl diphosphate synthase|uniref:heptaprenyl diphosphate synthase component II n=1 Tax=Caenibacillus caldisaponilyticus TaxID=1674942 RepID=UPI00098871E4|nr:heptaprenyl diphosphate synthase component II [Caenibacillus caldisaponilyticus]